MKTLLFFLCSICILLSGCGNQTRKEFSQQDSSVSVEHNTFDPDKIYFLDFEQNLKSVKVDTFTINSLAQKISFTPLETLDNNLLMTEDFKVAAINGRYYISSGTGPKFSGIMEFDATGRFMDYLIQKGGRGPKELPATYEWSCNQKAQLLVASSLYEILVHSFENNTTNKFSLGGFFVRENLMNNGTIVGIANSVMGDGETDTPYLHFRNREGEIVHSLYYPQKRDIAYHLPEGQGPMETYHLYPDYSGDVLFKDMFNDTIYRIRGFDDVKPYIIIHRGLLALTIKEVTNRDAMVQKVCIRGVLDTKMYIFIKYLYRDVMNCIIWDKQSMALIANTKADSSREHWGVIYHRASNGFTKYRAPNGKEILIAISSYFDGKLYSFLDASQAMDFLPDIKEDDNPVLMIIDLKNQNVKKENFRSPL